MEKIILYVDDAAYAREFLAKLSPEAGRQGCRGIGCWWLALRA